MLKKAKESACSVVSLQSESNRTEHEHEPVRDSDLAIDISSDVQSCDYSDIDHQKCFPSNEYNFEQDIEKLIAVSKQFQEEYENESVNHLGSVTIEDTKRNSNIKILTPSSTTATQENQHRDVDNYYFTSSSSRFKKENIVSTRSHERSNKSFTPKLPNPGPFGTGIIRPSPKKHSCVQKSVESSAKRSHKVTWHIRPYSTRYYDFDRTHPHLELVKNGETMVPKRIFKDTIQMDDKSVSKTTMKKPLLNKGITWHEFFERSNVYSSKSLQSSQVDELTHTTSIQTIPSQRFSPTLNNIKIQKHTLPQLNIPAECCVQPIPPISIAPNGCKRIVNSNIKLVEIIYEDSESVVKSIESPVKESIDLIKDTEGKINEQQLHQSDSEYIPAIEIHQNTKIIESKISFSTSTKTSSSSHGYESSFEESISLNVSHDEAPKSLELENSIQRKRKKFVKNRKDTTMQHAAIITSSDFSDFEYDDQHKDQHPQSQQVSNLNPFNIKLPSFPTNELMQLVDEIFDTSSDHNENNLLSHKNVFKESSVQTDIVWQNINEFLRQQRATNADPRPDPIKNNFPSFVESPIQLLSKHQIMEAFPVDDPCMNQCTNDNMENKQIRNSSLAECIHTNRENSIKRYKPKEYCSHSYMKNFKICSCLTCKNNIEFSVTNVHHPSQSQQITSSTSSSSPAVETSKQRFASAKTVLPSERYKRMKQAQREHFENDPRISKTLKNIYEAAKRVKLRNEQSLSSSSSNHYQSNDPLSSTKFSNVIQDESLHPDLYTFSDEILLFGLHTTDETYSSHLLKTESSQDTSTSNGRFCGLESIGGHYKNRLMCTNSEDSSNNSFYNKRGSDMERCLMKDIENSWSDPAVFSMYSTSSLERKINEIQLDQSLK